MEKSKENALHDYIIMTGNAWTVDRMTEKEKDTLLKLFHSIQTEKALKGSYNQRWKTLQAIFNAYLQGLGYTGYDWRESKKQPF